VSFSDLFERRCNEKTIRTQIILELWMMIEYIFMGSHCSAVRVVNEWVL